MMEFPLPEEIRRRLVPALERNLRLIGWHEILTSTAPWGVVLMLFNWARFDVDGAIALSGIYYLSVVVFEVPSGWASDRFGRVPTLRLVGLAWMAAFACWLVLGDNYLAMAAGNVLVAAGYASLSGTDVSFHYDTLEALGRADEFADRQARIVARARVFGTLGAIGGGALGLIDLRIPFLISFVLAGMQFALTLHFEEPPHLGQADSVIGQVRRCLGYLNNIPLRWIFGYGIAMVVLEHVAFNLFTPWLAETLGDTAEDVGATPLISGFVLAAMGLIGGAAARLSTPAARRFGVRRVLVFYGALSALIVTMMAAFQHIVILVFVVLRSIQGAAAPILISAAVAPHVEQRHRATLLSLNSLGGRALWGAILVLLAGGAGDNVARTLTQYALISWVLVVATLATAAVVRRRHGTVAL